MIQVTIGRGDELEGAQADVVHSLVVSWKLEALQAVARLGLLASLKCVIQEKIKIPRSVTGVRSKAQLSYFLRFQGINC
jgi:hypothetical protein